MRLSFNVRAVLTLGGGCWLNVVNIYWIFIPRNLSKGFLKDIPCPASDSHTLCERSFTPSVFTALAVWSSIMRFRKRHVLYPKLTVVLTANSSWYRRGLLIVCSFSQTVVHHKLRACTVQRLFPTVFQKNSINVQWMVFDKNRDKYMTDCSYKNSNTETTASFYYSYWKAMYGQ